MSITKPKKDFTSGPIFIPMLLFVLPIMLTGVLQVLYNIADNVVVGQFSGDPNALAAVGSTSSITNLVVNMLMGIASGAGVVVAQSFGAKDDNTLTRAVHTAITLSAIGGIIFAIIGLLVSAPALTAMDTKPEILDKSILYMRIICAGIPALSVYNFGATILRSVGDSKTPLFILSTSGIVNVILNLIFVIPLRMSIAGVALATIISQYISAAVIVFVLAKRKDKNYGLDFRKLRLEKAMMIRILRFGLPAGIQGSIFSVSNVIITAATNSFSTTVISAKTIAGNLEGLLYTALNSYMHASITFVGQNRGANDPKRMKKSVLYSVIQVGVIGLILGELMLIFGRELSMMYIDASDPNLEEVLATSMDLLRLMLRTYVLCGIMEALAGALRGLGYSISPMLVNIIGTCGMRITWVAVFFPMESLHSITGLFYIYPISWTTTSIVHTIILITAFRKMKRLFPKTNEQEQLAKALK